MALADRDGLTGLSMRRLAQHLGVDAMSIYYHLRDKDALLAAMADAVAAELTEAPTAPGPWTAQLRSLIMQAAPDDAAPPVGGPRARGPGHARPPPSCATSNGCSPSCAAAAARSTCATTRSTCSAAGILGFSQDLFDDSPDTRPSPEEAAAQASAWAEAMPHVAELAVAVSHNGALGGCDDDAEFAFALDLLLDALDRHRQAESNETA